MSGFAARTAGSGSSADGLFVRVPFRSTPPRGDALTLGDKSDGPACEKFTTERLHEPEGQEPARGVREQRLMPWLSLNRGHGDLHRPGQALDHGIGWWRGAQHLLTSNMLCTLSISKCPMCNTSCIGSIICSDRNKERFK